MTDKKTKDDGDGIVSAAVLKICKACESADTENIDSCIDTQIDYCLKRLKEQINEPDGDTPARRNAIAQIPEKKDEIITTLLKAKEN